MSKKAIRVAVIGGGVSGLTAAYVLAGEGVEVVVYEKEDTLGGSAKTVSIDETSFDLNFMLFTRVMYPEVMELFESLGVDMELSDISFSVSLNEGLENNPDIDRNETLEHFVRARGYSELFQKAFLIPTCASIWSCSSGIMTFSAYSVLSFLCNHDVLELLGQPGRLTPRWHSQNYVNRIKKELESRGCQVRINSQVYSVSTNDEGCAIKCKDGLEEVYDGCIIAVHAPDALNILGKQGTYDELRLLGCFKDAYSDIFLHHDNNLMPKNPAAWGSRNFVGTTSDEAYITYWLNNIQDISKLGIPLFLTLNPPCTPKNTLHKWSISHPIPSVPACKASSELHLIQGKRRLWFSGAYQGYGFPEDRIKAGIFAAKGFLRKSYVAQNHPKHMVPSSLESGARILVTRFLKRFIATGSLILLEEGGTIFTFEGTRERNTLRITLRVHTLQFYWKVATEAELGFADAYINGDVSFVDKNDGLLNFFLMMIANTEVDTYSSKLNKRRGWWTPLFYTSIIASAKYFSKHVSDKNTLSQARKNISQHYDLTPEEDLKSAQLRKGHTLIDKARLKKDHHILELGCGWGSFALEAVKKTGCKYTGITLSEKQLHYVESKVKEAGLHDHIEILLCDYRQLPADYKYDRIIVCGMIEHVGHEFIEEFFKCSESLLARNGLLVLQFIAVADEKYDDMRNSPGFIKEYIFHGGCLPSLSRVLSAMAAASRLSVVHLEEIGCHYYDTLRCWRENFFQNQSQVLALGFDDKFIRTWEYYFDYCAAGFKYCILGDYQIVFSRPGDVAAFGNNPYNPLPSSR